MSVVEPPRKRQKQHLVADAQSTRSSTSIERRIDFTSALLSDEIVLHIFSFLSASDLSRCAEVNKTWFRLANDEQLWKPLFLRRFRHLPVPGNRGYTNLQHQTSGWCSPVSFHSKQQSRVPWKTMYKTNHNWRTGNCHISQLDVGVHCTKDESTAKQQRLPNISDPLVQFNSDTLCLAYISEPVIEIWHIRTKKAPIPLGRLATSVDNVRHITCLKLESTSSRTGAPHVNRLIAGYENGGFSVWEFTKYTHDEMRIDAKEIAVHIPRRQRKSSVTSVESIGIAYPMIITCTSDMKLAAFYIDLSKRNVSLRLVYELQSAIRWKPIVVELERVEHQGDQTFGDRWRAIVCFGMPVGLNSYSVGVQEIILSKDTILCSRHCTALHHDNLFFTPTSHDTNSGQDNTEPITALAYSAPYLTTAHANNTIKQYHVNFSSHGIEVVYVQTLYGHTCKVSALAINASVGRMVSGDRCGLKVWDISPYVKDKRGHDGSVHGHTNHENSLVNGVEYLVAIENELGQQRLAELPPWNMEWLQFDSDKIIAVLRDADAGDASSIRIWSFVDT